MDGAVMRLRGGRVSDVRGEVVRELSRVEEGHCGLLETQRGSKC